MGNNPNSTNITNSTSQDENAAQDKQKVLDNMKGDVKNFLELLIDFNETNSNENKIVKTGLFSSQLTSDSPDNKNASMQAAIENRMAFADFSDCQKILKSYYNISEDINLLINKVEFDPMTDVKRANDSAASQGVSFEFINPLTKEKLNNTLCESVPTPISIPFKKSERINMQMYQKAATVKAFLDLYNSNSPGYHSRCFKTTQFDTGADVSLNYKRTNMFQNQTVSCSPGCIYEGLDENKYVKCNCTSSGNNEISNSGNDEYFSPLPKMNYDIIMCYKETYNDVIFLFLIIHSDIY